jgi:hypothetical protein
VLQAGLFLKSPQVKKPKRHAERSEASRVQQYINQKN